MSAATNLKHRGSVYYCRRRIPQDLINHFEGRKELAVSLRTTSLREARLRANEQWRKWEAEFEKLRRGNGAAAMAELSDEQVQALADEHYAGMLKWDEHSREQGLSDEDYEERDAEVALVDSFAPAALARGDARRGGFITHLTLKRHGITLPKDSPSHRRLTYALLKATVKANDAVRMRQQGKVVDTPRAPAAILGTAKRNGVKLAGVLEKWAAERAPRSKTKTEWSGIVRDFTKLNGDLPVGSIEKAHVVA